MAMSNISSRVEAIVRDLKTKPQPLVIERIAGELAGLAAPRGGVELAHVCDECGELLDDDEVQDHVECPNCNNLFYEL